MVSPFWRMFQSTYLYKVRLIIFYLGNALIGFNPRTYIRYDCSDKNSGGMGMFQSTYLYKVRRLFEKWIILVGCFNPRTYIRYDGPCWLSVMDITCFNPRTYIRYDVDAPRPITFALGFQSTYLYKVRHRRDIQTWYVGYVSIHVPI